MRHDGAVGTRAGTRVTDSELVGRSEDLATIAAELEGARAGTARIVLVTGEPGVGKTALCRTAVERAEGFRVLRAGGEASESALVYGVVLQLLTGMSGPPAAALGASPLAVGATLLQLISDLETQSPVLIWIDDLQWADPPSQRALLFLLRRLQADPVLVLLSQREPAALAPGLARHLDGEACQRLTLRGLSEQDLVAMAEGAATDLPRSAIRRLHEHTGGNPLWALALLRETPTARLLEAGGRLPAPRSFAAIIAERLVTLSPQARGLVEACAVGGTDSTLGLLGAVAPLGASFAALTEAMSAQLVLSSPGAPPVVRMGHALIASAVYDEMPPTRRAALHAAFSRAAPTEHERLRHEIAASPGHDASLSDRVAQAAATIAAGGAWSVASDMFHSAARLSPDLETQGERFEQAMTAALLGGDAPRAALLGERLRTYPETAHRHSLLGWLALLQARYNDAERLLREAVRLGDATGALGVVAEASRLITHLLLILGRGDAAIPYARRAVEVAPTQSIEAGVARGALAMALSMTGRFDEATRLTVDVDERCPRPDELSPLLSRGAVGVTRGDFEDAVRDLRAVIDATRAAGAFEFLCVAHGQLALAQYHLGDWDASVEQGELGVRVAEDAEQNWALSPVHAHASFAPSRRGDWTTAGHHVELAKRAAGALSDEMASSTAYAATAAAVLAHSRHDHEGVLAAVQPILRLRFRIGIDQPGLLEWPALYGEALVRAGQLTAADRFVRRYRESCDEAAFPWPMSAARRMHGLLLAARDDLPAALGELEDAKVLAERAGAVFQSALGDLHHGQVLRRAGRRRDAITVLNRGLATMAELGASPFVELATRELVAAGVEQRPKPVSNPSGLLTPQELTVSRLVSQGLTNRDIAAELFISTKTVEFHLGNAYRKLGVNSRTRLVHLLARD